MNKFYLQLAAAIVAGIALMWGIGYISDLRKAAAQGAVDKGKLGTTTAVIADSDAADVQRSEGDAVVADARGTFQNNQQEAKRNEPTTRNRADAAVPASVRKNFRERRLARERLGRDAVGDEEGAGGTDAAKR